MKQPKPATCVRVKRSQLLNEVVSSAVSLRFKRWWKFATRGGEHNIKHSLAPRCFWNNLNVLISFGPLPQGQPVWKVFYAPSAKTPLFFPARCCLKVWSVSVSFPFIHGRNRSLSHASVTRHCVENIFLLLDEMIYQMNHLIFFFCAVTFLLWKYFVVRDRPQRSGLWCAFKHVRNALDLGISGNQRDQAFEDSRSHLN